MITKNRQGKCNWLWPLYLIAVCFVALSSGALALAENNGPDELLLQLKQKPSGLRLADVRKQLSRLEKQSYNPLMRSFMLNSSLPWDIRTHAYILLGKDRSDKDIKKFTSIFKPLEVAAS